MIIDTHIHYGDSVRMNMKTSTVDLIQEMDKNGISKAICIHIEALLYSMESGNRKTLELMTAHPDRILGYCTIPSARLGTSVIPHIETCIKEYGMVGVKMYSVPYPGTDRVWIPFSVPSFYPVLAAVEALSVPLLVHASPEEVEKVASRFPNLNIIMAHSGNAPEMHGQWHRAVYAAKKYSNIYLDMCGSTIDIDCLCFALEELGPSRIIYGSDWPLFKFEFALARFRSLELSSREEEQMLSENAQRLFDIS